MLFTKPLKSASGGIAGYASNVPKNGGTNHEETYPGCPVASLAFDLVMRRSMQESRGTIFPISMFSARALDEARDDVAGAPPILADIVRF